MSLYDPDVQARFSQLQQLFQTRGLASPPDLAAVAALYGMVVRQASMLAFIDMFRLLGIVFLVMIPLVFLMRRPRGGQAQVAVAAE